MKERMSEERLNRQTDRKIIFKEALLKRNRCNKDTAEGESESRGLQASTYNGVRIVKTYSFRLTCTPATMHI